MLIPPLSPLQPILLRVIAVLGWEPQARPGVLGRLHQYRNSFCEVYVCIVFPPLFLGVWVLLQIQMYFPLGL